METILIIFYTAVIGYIFWMWGFLCSHGGFDDGWEMCKALIPTCFGKPNTPNGMAENGCEDCEFKIECEMRREQRK